MDEDCIDNIKDKLIYKDALIRDELLSCVEKNFWIEYFCERRYFLNENWIDFELEISSVIQKIDNSQKGNCDDDKDWANRFLWCWGKVVGESIEQIRNADLAKMIKYITPDKIKTQLQTDLENLIRAYEIYLAEYVEKLEIKQLVPEVANLDIDKVLSFNYTHTYEKYYNSTKTIEYNYIHGECKKDSSSISNNMVLGIDEYLTDEAKDRETEYVFFKKFYQRIYKGTGTEYKKWVNKIVNNRFMEEDRIRAHYSNQIPFARFGKKHQVYIYGHSLDITDRDILRELILNDNVYTTIFYLNKKVLAQQITNLVKVIGQEELIRRTGGSTKTIEFRECGKLS